MGLLHLITSLFTLSLTLPSPHLSQVSAHIFLTFGSPFSRTDHLRTRPELLHKIASKGKDRDDNNNSHDLAYDYEINDEESSDSDKDDYKDDSDNMDNDNEEPEPIVRMKPILRIKNTTSTIRETDDTDGTRKRKPAPKAGKGKKKAKTSEESSEPVVDLKADDTKIQTILKRLRKKCEEWLKKRRKLTPDCPKIGQY